MSYPDVLLPVALIWGIAAITPGPNLFIMIHTAISQTRRLALFSALGILVGTVIWAVSGFFGISILFKTLPALYYALKFAGGLYLIYLGLSLLAGRKKNHGSGRDKNGLTPYGCFKLGLHTNLLNPKTAAFMTSLYAATIPAEASYELGALCVILICSISAVWYSLVAVVFSQPRVKTFYEKGKTSIQRVAGGIFLFFGLKLAVSE